MVEKRNCSLCGEEIEPGTGKMYVKKDGTVYNFCSNKCKKNRIDIGRVPRRTRWTIRYKDLKASTLSREAGTGKGQSDKAAKKEGKDEKAAKKTGKPKTGKKPAEKKAPVTDEEPESADE